jgi:hypothetical protein
MCRTTKGKHAEIYLQKLPQLVFILAFCCYTAFSIKTKARPPTIPKRLLGTVQYSLLLIDTCQEIMQAYVFSPSLLNERLLITMFTKFSHWFLSDPFE